MVLNVHPEDSFSAGMVACQGGLVHRKDPDVAAILIVNVLTA
jgi:hypothetical protein